MKIEIITTLDVKIEADRLFRRLIESSVGRNRRLRFANSSEDGTPSLKTSFAMIARTEGGNWCLLLETELKEIDRECDDIDQSIMHKAPQRFLRLTIPLESPILLDAILGTYRGPESLEGYVLDHLDHQETEVCEHSPAGKLKQYSISFRLKKEEAIKEINK